MCDLEAEKDLATFQDAQQMKEALELSVQKELVISYQVRLDDLDMRYRTLETNSSKKKALLKKKLAETEWLNDEYKEEVKTLKSQFASQSERLCQVDKELEEKQAEFQSTVKQLHQVYEKQKMKVKQVQDKTQHKEQKLQKTIKDLYMKQELMTPRKSQLTITGTPKSGRSSAFAFPSSTSPRANELGVKSISDLLSKD